MEFASVRTLRIAVVFGAIVLGTGLSWEAEASPIDYTIVMNNVSGFFGAGSFSNQQVTLTMTADTSTVLPYGNPSSPFGYQNTVTPGGVSAITVQVGSGPVTDITGSMTVSGPNQFSNNTLSFYLGNSIAAPRGFTYTWDSSYPGALAVLTTDQFSTNSGLQVESNFALNPLPLAGGGTFYVDATVGGQAGSFGSTVAVPEPSTATGLLVASLGGLAWMRIRRLGRRS